jgi:novobiocin biosynthesis protein NovU/D-mycarose 3-C-methyltransferase
MYHSPHTNPKLGTPLEVLFCGSCGLSQLSLVVEPEILYSQYNYHSGVSSTFKRHCENLARWIATYYPGGHVLDIAANDGTLVTAMQKMGLQAFGVEPAANLVAEAVKNGIPLLEGFWDKYTAARCEPVKVITALNVVAHVDDLIGFFGHVRYALDERGMFIFEVPYLAMLTDRLEFDTIYHEHLSYFLVGPLNTALEKAGLNIHDIEEIDIHGGSLRVTASPLPVSSSAHVARFIEEERVKRLYSLSTYEGLGADVKEVKQAVTDWFSEHEHVVGFGAAAKGTVLINYCRLEEKLRYVVDDTPAKQGKAIPGTRIPIRSREELISDDSRPEVLILAWNFVDEIVRSLPADIRQRCWVPYRCDGSDVQAAGIRPVGTTDADEALQPRAICEVHRS